MFSFILGIIGFLVIGFLSVKQLLFIVQYKKELSKYDFWQKFFELLGLVLLTICFTGILALGVTHVFY